MELQKPGTLVSGDCVIWLRCFDKVEKIAVRRVGGMVPSRQPLRPQICPVQVIQHRSNLIWVEKAAHLRSAAGDPDLIDLLLTGDQSEPPPKPSIVYSSRRAGGGNQRAEEEVAVEKD